MNPLADYVLAHLADTTPLTVTFTKADGTERRMTCTTNRLLIPNEMLPHSSMTTYVSEDVIRAFDLEKNGWRSFRKDSILRVETISKIPEPVKPEIVDISEL